MSNFNIVYNASEHLTIITPNEHENDVVKYIMITPSEYNISKHIIISQDYSNICSSCHLCQYVTAVTNDGGSTSFCSYCNIKFKPPKILVVKLRDYVPQTDSKSQKS